MVCFLNQNVIENDRLFYKKLEKEQTNSFEIMCQILNNYEYIFLQEKRFLFVSRIKFAKRYCNDFFNKDYDDLNKLQRFYLTYFIFCKDIIKAYTEFQMESNYQVFKKMNLNEINDIEQKLINIDNECLNKYTKLVNIYRSTNYYKKKNDDRKEFDNKPISTPMSTHGHYANLSSQKVFGFYIKIKEDVKKMNEIIYNENFDFFYNEKMKLEYNSFKKNDINNIKVIFNNLKIYFDELKDRDSYHSNELNERTYDEFVHFSNSYSLLSFKFEDLDIF